jgi:hypothetical protein
LTSNEPSIKKINKPIEIKEIAKVNLTNSSQLLELGMAIFSFINHLVVVFLLDEQQLRRRYWLGQ